MEITSYPWMKYIVWGSHTLILGCVQIQKDSLLRPRAKNSALKIFQLLKLAMGFFWEIEILECSWGRKGAASKLGGMHLPLWMGWGSGRGHLFGTVCQENSRVVSCLRPCRGLLLIHVNSKILGSGWLCGWVFSFVIFLCLLQWGPINTSYLITIYSHFHLGLPILFLMNHSVFFLQFSHCLDLKGQKLQNQ